MIVELRAAVKEWLEYRCGSKAAVYYDFVPEHDNSDTVIAFNIITLDAIADISNHNTLATYQVEIYINGRERAKIDEIADLLLVEDIQAGSVIDNVFYQAYRDIEYDPTTDVYFCSVLTLKFKGHI